MREYEYFQVDVFTSEPFTGNPLAVIPDAGGLTPREMMMIAREFYLPETTFIVPPETPDALFRMRIFTPTVELPFTGHPAVGGLWVMAELGRIELTEPVTTICYEQGVGPLTADLHVVDGRIDRIVMEQCPPVFLAELRNVNSLASALGVNPDEITSTGLTPQVVSTGMPQLMVPFRSLSAVQRLNAAEMELVSIMRVLNGVGSSFMHVWTTETVNPESTVHARGFAHLVGIPEDPVTGNANGALGAYLVRYGVVPLTGSRATIVSEQGIEVGRPGSLTVEVDHDNGVPRAVRVGGRCVQVARGVIRF